MEEPTVRNERPFAKAFGIAFAVIVSLFLILQLRGGSRVAFETAGALSFQILVGALVFGVWAKRAKTRWSAVSFAWRFILCLVLAFLVTSFFMIAGGQ